MYVLFSKLDFQRIGHCEIMTDSFLALTNKGAFKFIIAEKLLYQPSLLSDDQSSNRKGNIGSEAISTREVLNSDKLS